MMSDAAKCLREHFPVEKELQFADDCECVIDIKCQECGNHDSVSYHDDL